RAFQQADGDQHDADAGTGRPVPPRCLPPAAAPAAQVPQAQREAVSLITAGCHGKSRRRPAFSPVPLIFPMRTRSSKAARLADVARLAKVSTATVSRALTLPHKVKARTLERVQQAARSLGY